VPDIVSGPEWLEKRLAFLEEELEREDDEVTRVAIQAEIDVVRGDLGRTRGTRRRFWILGARLPHEPD
jgi:hypothetical protein